MASIKPYKISIPDTALKILHKKLDLATFPDETDYNDDWDSGAPLSDVKRLAKRWRNEFDWRAQEARLNELPHFTTRVDIDGFGSLNIHFVHRESERKQGAIPLLFVHGWPGSFLEVTKILPLLTDSKDGPSFHVVAPSLPNFGFSDAAPWKGFSIPQYAEAMHKVMVNLGYNNYVTQGGDWGYMITRLIGVQYPSSCLASHVNTIPFVTAPSASSLVSTPLNYVQSLLLPYAPEEQAGLDRSHWFEAEGRGYNLLQSTRPSTIAFALRDSPVSLLAWVYEKLHDWTDSYPWTDDEILTWISIYAFSVAGPQASVRIYYEYNHSQLNQIEKGKGYVKDVKLGVSRFPKDLTVPPRTWGRGLGDVVFERWHESGGHFSAYERPDELARDVKDMFGKDGGANDVAQKFV